MKKSQDLSRYLINFIMAFFTNWKYLKKWKLKNKVEKYSLVNEELEAIQDIQTEMSHVLLDMYGILTVL